MQILLRLLEINNEMFFFYEVPGGKYEHIQ